MKIEIKIGDPPDLDCPCCGQSGLNLVRLPDLESKMFVLCRECESIWEGTAADLSMPDFRFEEYARSKGIEANWKRMEYINAPPP
ncbi:hypothetical protein JIN84_05665 [Luteolibacter yonseiensis]|uniref:Uncharacterized protein n=2 Tax=Luteolibacter yonseiensis TaxID=1144680 RepID=A0A934QYK8_9BACT|nr:hypothetical protein [Luteolibacter yonseiensis]MBK1815088.1 hypothetical protein [Luteolibacter yonseiensis]